MRLLRFGGPEGTGIAIVGGDGRPIGLLSSDGAFPGDLDALVAEGSDALRAAGEACSSGRVLDPAATRWLCPLARPGKIICVGLNYADHSAESGFKQPDYPTLFARFPTSLIAHDELLIRPRASEQLDYEGELVAIIGKGGRGIAKSAALDHVVGYSVFNDGSIRDYQHRTPQWTMGKNFDGTGAFGPYLVTTDDLPPGCAGLRLETRLNGQIVQSATIDDLVFDVATLVATISECCTLEPGDMIVTGTPAGVGAARTPPLWMKAGDVCEVEIEGVGLLRNTIADEVQAGDRREASDGRR
jgi:2-keto-4-pentenoate hydratase/2-oxohepta-3-ene-1,7-dioic acid hydratase in catechol pathway